MLNRMNAEERYTRAVQSTNLRVSTETTRSDVDVLIAAGWSRSRMGQSLLRLAGEYDGAARSGRDTPMDAAMFVGKLRTLPEVRSQLGLLLARWGVNSADDQALRVIAWWLHKTCSKCHGRGYDVVPGAGRLSGKICSSCCGSGQTPIPCGEAGRRLASYMDDCVSRARQSIGRGLGRN